MYFNGARYETSRITEEPEKGGQVNINRTFSYRHKKIAASLFCMGL